jgi:hypothetical protein
MFEQIFDEYRKAVDSSFKLQEDMYRQWLNGWPIKPQSNPAESTRSAVEEKIRSYRQQWSDTLAETLENHRETLNAQYKSGIEAIRSAFRTTEAKTPEEYWRLTQEFWRKSIDLYKTAFEAQTKHVQNLSQMWLEMLTKGKV